MIFLSTLLISIFLTIVLVPLFGQMAHHYQLVDQPGERKVHKVPIPRVGGMAMALGAFVPILLWQWENAFVRTFLLAAGILVAFGVVDDLRELRPGWKFLGQIAAALIVVLFGGVKIVSLGGLLPAGTILPSWFAVPFTVFAIVGVTNAINLSDGLDGLAGGICLLSFSCLGYLAYLEGDAVVGFITLALIGGVFGFLRYNTYPASVFMGDTGSQLLGFSAVTLSLALTQESVTLSPVLPLLLLGFPILDTLTVMAVRIARGKSPFAADKNHFHHHLMGLGLHHTESVLVIYVFQIVLVVGAFFLRFHSDWFLLSGYLVFSAAVLALFSISARTGWSFRRWRPLLRGKLYLKWLRDETRAICYLFRALEVSFPLLLVGTVLLAGPFPRYLSWGGAALLGLIGGVWLLRPRALGDLLRLVLYLLIPLVVYEADQAAAEWSETAERLYHVAFGLFALLTISVSQLSKRKRGFKSTPLDFLILFLALVVPNLPNLRAYHLGLVASKILILYFGCEVLLAETRGPKYGRIAAGVTAVLAVLLLNGLL